ncbi:hypothetical protein BDF14DRAFT_903760 [Spinellus fusiger]|nr:hypothetical protein BDF14DRAFT_903760 [Spinellus fusiger]
MLCDCIYTFAKCIFLKEFNTNNSFDLHMFINKDFFIEALFMYQKQRQKKS